MNLCWPTAFTFLKKAVVELGVNACGNERFVSEMLNNRKNMTAHVIGDPQAFHLLFGSAFLLWFELQCLIYEN